MPAVYLRSKKKRKHKKLDNYVSYWFLKSVSYLAFSPIRWPLDEGVCVWREETVFLMLSLSKNLLSR